MLMKEIEYLPLEPAKELFKTDHSSCLLEKRIFHKFIKSESWIKQITENIICCRNKCRKENQNQNEGNKEKDDNKEIIPNTDQHNNSSDNNDEQSHFIPGNRNNENWQIKNQHVEINNIRLQITNEQEKNKIDDKYAAEKLELQRKKQIDAKKLGYSKCNVQAIEFDWIFDRNDTKYCQRRKFLEALANTKDIEIFSVDIIKNIIFYLWESNFKKIQKLIMTFFIFYFAAYIIYATWIKKGKDYLNQTWRDYGTTDFVFCIILIFLILCFAFIEIIQMLYLKVEYFKKFWNIIDIASVILNMFCVITDFAGLNSIKHIPVLACSVLIMWLKLVYFGRMFLSTAWMVRMKIQVIWDLKWFMFLFCLMLLGFANSFYIISRVDANQFTGNTFDKALEYTYQTVIGAFNTSVIPATGYNVEIYIIWLICTFLIFIVMLNMLITLITDIFNRNFEIIKQNTLQEFAKFMIEYDPFISKNYKGKKYIVVVKKEETAVKRNNDHDSVLEKMKKNLMKQNNRQIDILNAQYANIEQLIYSSFEKQAEDFENLNHHKYSLLEEKTKDTIVSLMKEN